MSPGPLVRIEEAALGADAQVRLVVSGLSDPDRLRSAWASSGATLERVGERIRATTTVQALARAAGRALGGDEARLLDASLRQAVSSWIGPSPPLLLPGGRSLATDVRPLVMGVVNVTPDSFSDGGLVFPRDHPDTAVGHARRLVAAGADVLDVGGESTRPGAEPVDVDEELRRVLPVLERLRDSPAPRSIDTMKSAVAKAAVAAGATIVNDVSGARDPELLDVVAASGAGYVLMHTRGRARDMQSLAVYDDVVAEVHEFLAAGLERCTAAGIVAEQVVVDPGLGFAKTADHNLQLLRALRQLRGLGRPVLAGASRKSFIGAVLDAPDPSDRLEGSLACAALAAAQGAAVLRVHDVAPTVRVARMVRAIATGDVSWPPATT
ncbi:MAG: dihydropteroate synthase [Actinomycetota bacterium]|nr:dihydropteroate synthase [Actinomycetota bacterium]